MSCAAFTAVSFYAAFKNKENRWVVAATALLAVLFFGVASFQAWDDEHKNLTALQKRLASPELTVVINAVYWGGDDGHRLVMIVAANILNPFGPPTSLVDWKVSLREDGRDVEGEIPMLPEKDFRVAVSASQKMNLNHAYNLFIQTTKTPIPAGGVAPGWLMVVFKEIPSSTVIADGSLVTLSFEDVVSSTRHSSTQTLHGSNGVYVPGVGVLKK